MNYRNSLLALTLATGFSAAPTIHALEIGTFNDTTFSIGGYVKAEGLYEKVDGGDSRIFGRANETRINLKAETQQHGHSIVGFIEGDFYGGSYPGETSDLRLRHAFIKINQTTVGQTWTGQFWSVAYHDYLDFLGGPRGTLGGFNFRTNLISHEVAGLRFTAQDPVNNDAEIPDLAVNYSLKLDGGHSIILTASGREIVNGDFVAGGALGSKFMIGPHSFNLNAHYGDGLGAFTGVGVNNSLAAPDVENGDSVSQKGFDVGFRYVINNTWRTNVAYTAVDVDDEADTSYRAYRANLIHSMTPDIDVGVEWRKYNLAFGPLLPDGQQVELMAKYKF
ncbi:porin [Pseudomonas sp.]|uniref:porin n=1 Tax=Pseudomonas sp. TaxID=306 RepID=UPI002729ADD7|nr:porin [Pseudomonas sp.]